MVGDKLNVVCSSTAALVGWTNVDHSSQCSCKSGLTYFYPCFQDKKTVKEPKFSKLTYADSGRYECEVSMAGLVKNQSFELTVEGQ